MKNNINNNINNKDRLSFGLELEFGDIDRTIDIPEYLGCWDGPKIDGIYRSVEEDVYNPLIKARTSFNSLYGGEINTQPSKTVDGAWVHYIEIMKYFRRIDDSTGHGHIHVRVSDLTVEELRNMVHYIKLYQKDVIKTTYFDKKAFETLREKSKDKYYRYVIYDSGRPIKEEVLDALLDFLEEYNNNHPDCLLCEARSDLSFYLRFKEIVSKMTEDRNVWTNEVESDEVHSRAALNIYNLLFSNTLEFRGFHETINPLYKYSSILFTQNFMLEALRPINKQKSVFEVLSNYNYKFAPMRLDNLGHIYTIEHTSVKLQNNNMTCNDEIDNELLQKKFNKDLLEAIKRDIAK